jgi:hypothetical protein
LCKELNFEYIIPENISEKDDETTFENDELNDITSKINNMDADCVDDDYDEEYDDIPNYDEILI